jgi:ribonuclease R
MSEHLGEQFTGIISGVTNWGLYVELPNTIEGLVPIASISDDYYHYSEETFELIGERKNRHFKLGQTVKVIAEDCNLSARTIDFKLAEEKS